MTSSDNLWEDSDDKGVEEGGGNRSEQQHVSHQVPSGGDLVIAPVTLMRLHPHPCHPPPILH